MLHSLCLLNLYYSPPVGQEAIVVGDLDGYMPPSDPDILEIFAVDIYSWIADQISARE